MATDTYKVTPERLDALKLRLAKFTLKALKLGVTPPDYTVSGLNTKIVKVLTSDNALSGGDVRDKVIAWHDVTLTSEPIKLAGWTFVATLDHASEAGVILRAVPGETVPTSYRDAKPVCNHCGLDRMRKETFVVRHDDGTWKVVGRNCLADFMGVDPARAAELATMAIELRAGLDDEDAFASSGGGGLHHFSLVDFLDYVAVSIRTSGWLSRKAARDSRESVTSTADEALLMVFPPPRLKVPPVEPGDHDRAVAALAWARELRANATKELTDYEHNVYVVTAGEAITRKEAGIAASIIPTYERWLGRETERRLRAKNDAASAHFGEVGKREVFTLTPTDFKMFDSDFGVRTMAKFLDAAGNVAVWWTGEVSEPFEVGETIVVKATVKEHSLYNGVKQTVLSRVAPYTPPVKVPRAKKSAALVGVADTPERVAS
jgi:hypothetical protein